MNSQSQYGDSLSSALQYHVNQTGVPVTRIAKGNSVVRLPPAVASLEQSLCVYKAWLKGGDKKLQATEKGDSCSLRIPRDDIS
jgi:hypothetical protein